MLDHEQFAKDLVSVIERHQMRLDQVQGFGYGPNNMHLVVRDCMLRYNQVIWERHTTPQDYPADHAEMNTQINIYQMKLALEQLADKYEIRARHESPAKSAAPGFTGQS